MAFFDIQTDNLETGNNEITHPCQKATLRVNNGFLYQHIDFDIDCCETPYLFSFFLGWGDGWSVESFETFDCGSCGYLTDFK